MWIAIPKILPTAMVPRIRFPSPPALTLDSRMIVAPAYVMNRPREARQGGQAWS